MSDAAHINSNIWKSHDIQYTIYNTVAFTPLEDEVEVEDGLQCRAVGLIVGIIS